MPYFTQNGAGGSSGANLIQDRGAQARGMAERGSGSSFAARFGRILLQDGIAALPSALYHFGGKLDLYAQHIWFISYILSHKWDEDLPYPSLSGMSNCSGVSKRQLQRYRDELQSMGYLLVYPRHSQERGQETNAYDFAPLFEKIEYLVAEKRKSVQSAGDNDNGQRGEGWGNPDIGGSASSYNDQRLDPAVGAEWERVEKDPSFVARYGRVIARYGIAAVPRALFTLGKALSLTPQETWFSAYIFSYQWDTALPYPSMVRMAANSGYTRANLQNIRASLVAKGYLRIVQRNKADGTQDSNAYDFSPLLDEISKLLGPKLADGTAGKDKEGAETISGSATTIATTAIPSSGSSKKPRRGAAAVAMRLDRVEESRSTKVERTLQAPVGMEVDKRGNHPGDTEYAVPGVTQYAYWDDAEYAVPGDMQYTVPRDSQYAGPANQMSPAPATRGVQSPVTSPLHKVEPLKEQIEKNDSSQKSPILQSGNERNQTHPTAGNTVTGAVKNDGAPEPASLPSQVRPNLSYSAYIVQVASDFSYELGDGAHVLENASQTQRLWRTSCLDEQEFVGLMYEAKTRTRTAQNSHGSAGLNNKMAYFFTCLKGLLRND